MVVLLVDLHPQSKIGEITRKSHKQGGKRKVKGDRRRDQEELGPV